MKNKLFTKKLILSLLPAVVLGSVCAGVGGYFIYEQNYYNSHVIGKSNKDVFGQKEDTYFLLEYLGSATSKSMIKQLRDLEKETDIGWYLIDYSQYNKEELAKLGIDYDPQYRVITKSDKADEDKKLLYSSFGLKNSKDLKSEFDFVNAYGVPDSADISKTADNVSMYFTDLSYEKGDKSFTMKMKMKTENKQPMTFNLKNFYIKNLDTGKRDDNFVITTDAEKDRVTYEPYTEDGENSTPAEMKLYISIPETAKDNIKGFELVYWVYDKDVEEKNDSPLIYVTDSSNKIDESTSFRLPTPTMSLDAKTGLVNIASDVDSDGPFVTRPDDYYFYMYKGEFNKKDNAKETLEVRIKDDKSMTVNGRGVEYTTSDDKTMTATLDEVKYDFKFDKTTKELKVTRTNTDKTVDDTILKVTSGVKTVSRLENGETKTYNLDFASSHMTYYYRFKNSDEWTKYDPNVGIKASDIANNRLYVRSEYKFKNENDIEIKIYSMIGQYIKAHDDTVEAKFKIRLN